MSIIGTGNMGQAIASVVIKGGNTTELISHSDDGTPVTGEIVGLIAGDDAEAKSDLADVVTAGGLRAIDAGGLHRARELEVLGFLQITLAAQDKIPWTAGFAVVA